MSVPAADPGLARRRLLMLVPLGFAAAGGGAFWAMLSRMERGKFDPHALDNPLVGKPVPEFVLPGMGSAQGFSAAELRQAAARGPLLVNFYASWCVPCASEADLLGSIASQGLTVWGIDYKDTTAGSENFLSRYGNPYGRIAADSAGLTAIDWGVYGFPESFLIDRAGIVRWHIAGPLTEDNIREDLKPALKALS